MNEMVEEHLSDISSDGSTQQLSCLVGFVSLDSDRLFRLDTVSSEKERERAKYCSGLTAMRLQTLR